MRDEAHPKGRFDMSYQMPSNPKDVEMEAEILRSIRSMGNNLRVSAKGGHVTLSGTADEYSIKREIVSSVKGMPGVREVTNNIKVAP